MLQQRLDDGRTDALCAAWKGCSARALVGSERRLCSATLLNWLHAFVLFGSAFRLVLLNAIVFVDVFVVHCARGIVVYRAYSAVTMRQHGACALLDRASGFGIFAATIVTSEDLVSIDAKYPVSAPDVDRLGVCIAFLPHAARNGISLLLLAERCIPSIE